MGALLFFVWTNCGPIRARSVIPLARGLSGLDHLSRDLKISTCKRKHGRSVPCYQRCDGGQGFSPGTGEAAWLEAEGP